jgi:hypothetical protein
VMNRVEKIRIACRQSARSRASRARHALIIEGVRAVGMIHLLGSGGRDIREKSLSVVLAKLASNANPHFPLGAALASTTPQALTQYLRRNAGWARAVMKQSNP